MKLDEIHDLGPLLAKELAIGIYHRGDCKADERSEDCPVWSPFTEYLDALRDGKTGAGPCVGRHRNPREIHNSTARTDKSMPLICHLTPKEPRSQCLLYTHKSGRQLDANPCYSAYPRVRHLHGLCGVGSQEAGLSSRVETRLIRRPSD